MKALMIGAKSIPAKLPLFGARFRLISAFQDTIKGDETNVDDFAALGHAAIGLVWAGDPLDCLSLRECNRDMVEFGEHVFDALVRLGFHDIGELFKAGEAARKEIYDSIPTAEEVEEAADPFDKPAEDFTLTTLN
tara:strand:- start:253 stop:657 length:405 start_codon:yes stop_codon:yes gene_type:complete